MGTNWERKGGDIAYETLLKLEEMGIQAELIVCGSMPPPGIAHERMTVIPYLDKNDERQAREIEELYTMSDFLILPTRADCAPNVFKEANAFGLPVITTDTGGVADVVRDGENGLLVRPGDSEALAAAISRFFADDGLRRELAHAAEASVSGYTEESVFAQIEAALEGAAR